MWPQMADTFVTPRLIPLMPVTEPLWKLFEHGVATWELTGHC